MSDEYAIEEQIIQEQADVFQNITEIASQICGAQAAMINFLDDEFQWTMFNTGWKNVKIPREDSICQFTILQDELLYIPDTSRDQQLRNVQTVQNNPDIGFYAGINIKSRCGNKVGTLCVIDDKPRTLSKEQKKAIQTLADDIRARLELIRKNNQLADKNVMLIKISRFLKNSADIMLILHPESLLIEEAHLEEQGKLGYKPEEMTGTLFTDYYSSKLLTGTIKEWMEQNSAEKLHIETDIIGKTRVQFCFSLQMSMADNRLFVTGRNISELKQAEKQLDKEKRMMEGIIQNLPGIFCLIDVHGNLRRWNRNLEVITGYSGEELKDFKIEQLLVRDHIKVAYQKLAEVFKHEHARSELSITTKDGTHIPFLISGFRHKVEDETLAVVIGVNIRELKQAEHILKKTLKEREVLLGEIHHRVKNNLAVISGLFQLELMNIEDNHAASPINVLSKSLTRIKSIALVHEKLYASDDFKNICIRAYVNDLMNTIANQYQNGKEICIEKDIDDVQLNINLAIPVGLILNELTTNAFKHAFQGMQRGKINVKISSQNDNITMSIADNGNGLPEKIDLKNASSLGFTLINTLSSQLMAECSVESNPGTRFSFAFENRNYVKGAGGTVFTF
ncbi:MAG: histidine kinase dimerization/phosphoacceptor domain -containing protein [Balneolaceae bacterium]